MLVKGMRKNVRGNQDLRELRTNGKRIEMTELTIIRIFVAFLVVLSIGLAVHEWVKDDD